MFYLCVCSWPAPQPAIRLVAVSRWRLEVRRSVLCVDLRIYILVTIYLTIQLDSIVYKDIMVTINTAFPKPESGCLSPGPFNSRVSPFGTAQGGLAARVVVDLRVNVG